MAEGAGAPDKSPLNLFQAIQTPLIFFVIGLFFFWVLNPTFKMLEIRQQRHHPYHQVNFTPNPIVANREKEAIYLSVVIPVYNEQERLPKMVDETLEYLRTKQYTYEIIIVDDKSTDSTVQVVKQIMAGREGSAINLVQLSLNRGKGGAIKAGIEYTRGDYILMADADGATNISDLDKLFDAIKVVQEKDPSTHLLLGISVGSRAHLASKSVQTRSAIRTFLMRGFHFLVSILCSREIQDTQCGFKLFTRKTALILFRTMNIEGWAFDVELIYLAELYGIPIKEVDVDWKEVPGSKLIQHRLDVVTTSLSMLRDMLAMRMCYAMSLWILPEDLRREGMDVVEKQNTMIQEQGDINSDAIHFKKDLIDDEF